MNAKAAAAKNIVSKPKAAMPAILLKTTKSQIESIIDNNEMVVALTFDGIISLAN